VVYPRGIIEPTSLLETGLNGYCKTQTRLAKLRMQGSCLVLNEVGESLGVRLALLA